MVLLGLLVFLSLANRQSRGQEMTVNEFEAAVNAGQVSSAKFLEVDHKIVGEPGRSAKPVAVSVPPGGSVRVTVPVDSGIR